MKICPKCNKELKDSVKFCGGCGFKFPDGAAPSSLPNEGMTSCPNCGNQLKPGAKFCGRCGIRIQTPAETQNSPSDSQHGATQLPAVDNGGFVRWTMLPGQIAVKITEKEFDDYGPIKGLVVQDGIKALFFVDGRIAAELEAGSYTIEQNTNSGAPSSATGGGFLGFLRRAGTAVARAAANLFRAMPENPVQAAISAVLVRSTDFPLVFSVEDANTAGVRSEVGLHLLCKVANINEFYRNMLLDKKFVGFNEMQAALQPVICNQINIAVSGCTPDGVDNNPALAETALGLLQTGIADVYPFVEIRKILQLTASHQGMENLRRMAEELYVSEQELSHLQKRNDFLNRLQAAKNEQETIELSADYKHQLDTGTIEAGFRARKLEIYKQMELTQDEQDKFDLMLAAEKQLREAKTQEQIAAAMHEYEKSGLLRSQELDNLKRSIAQDGRMEDLRNTQAYDMAELEGRLALRRTQDAYDDERRQTEDAYSDSRREKDAAFQDSRRQSDFDFERQEQLQQLEMLRQAQALRNEREDAAHRRTMESENAARAHEETMQKQQLEAKIENQRIYAGMSFEQIMAANPDLSPEAAQAFSRKFEAEAAASANDKTAELLRQQVEMATQNKGEMMSFMQQMMERQNQLNMQQMAMMRDQSIAFAGQKQRQQEETIRAKQEELDRARREADRNQDRLLSGVQSTVTAAGVAFSGRADAPSAMPPAPASAQTPGAAIPSPSASAGKCPKCGADLEPGSSFCGECGSAL